MKFTSIVFALAFLFFNMLLVLGCSSKLTMGDNKYALLKASERIPDNSPAYLIMLLANNIDSERKKCQSNDMLEKKFKELGESLGEKVFSISFINDNREVTRDRTETILHNIIKSTDKITTIPKNASLMIIYLNFNPENYFSLKNTQENFYTAIWWRDCTDIDSILDDMNILEQQINENNIYKYTFEVQYFFNLACEIFLTKPQQLVAKDLFIQAIWTVGRAKR